MESSSYSAETQEENFGIGKKKNSRIFMEQSSTTNLVEPESSQFYCAQQNSSTELGMCKLIAKWNLKESGRSLFYLNKLV